VTSDIHLNIVLLLYHKTAHNTFCFLV